MILVVDHLRGARRGTRELFDTFERISIGRHPDSDVEFDARRDIDASTRHAELVWSAASSTACLADLGSSNGTWVTGRKIAKYNLPSQQVLEVEFGRGGPLLRFWIGESGQDVVTAPGRLLLWRRFLPW